MLQTFENQTSELVHLSYGDEEITTTPFHPFYVPQKGWTSAVDLRAGDILVTVNGEYVVLEKVQHEILENPVTVYNFEVEDFHTYYVGKTEVLVHNDCKITGSGHGSQTHANRIDTKITELKGSGKYTEIYGNRSLNTAGLNGTQRPDIIAKTKDGLYEVWEYASKSQASGTGGLRRLQAKLQLMKQNNPGVIFHDIIPW